MIKLVHADSKRSCSYFVTNGGVGLFVTLEFGAPKFETTKSSLSQLLEHAVLTQPALDSGVPSAIAKIVDYELRKAPAESDLPAWVFFVAVMASRERVEICMAGPHRVHLVRAAGVMGTCREHILRHDEPPPDWPAEIREVIDIELQGGIATRALGKMVSRPPETTIWQTTSPYRVVVCSSDVHQERDATTYLDECQGMAVAEGVGVVEYTCA